ncbi:14116_t:CDS:1 [Funneliformis mosseae]|uniref:14116_t:CDS:1 n=1 Tax=Funneliformis mosseae TaxID=27381 RepID=A0A9N9ELD0_FUNMO|nr:14116_t:CDS:1 [Funneliformis mosseae]
MQTTTFDSNFSIFDKKFISVVPNECSHSIDMEPLDGDQFWPKKHKSPNKLKKIISKTFKSLKRKILRKPSKVAVTKETMVSEITSFSTDDVIIEIDEIDDIDEIIDIYSSIPESLDKDEPNSSNIVEYEASSTCTLAENNIIDHIENESTKCNPMETNSILYIPYESVDRTINILRNISDCELKTLIEQKFIYPLSEDPVFVRINDYYEDSIDKHDERIYDIDFLNYLINIKKAYIGFIAILNLDYLLYFRM